MEKFNNKGYFLYENFLPQDILKRAKDLTLSIKKNVIDNELLGVKKNYGVKFYWRGIDMASILSDELYKMYTSDFMFNVAKDLLETDEIYLFNDQITTKLPNEDFVFQKHTDNELGPNNKMAINNEFRTITCCWVLDDFNENNGPIFIFDKELNAWVRPLPKAGDMIVWDGNTPHYSEKNTTNNPRSAWVLVYSNKDLTKIPSDKGTDYSKFYNKRFTIQGSNDLSKSLI
jgi:ectoine hydroxylase-related dioxygenase (phytanoyl-CoA dioxygenase family)